MEKCDREMILFLLNNRLYKKKDSEDDSKALKTVKRTEISWAFEFLFIFLMAIKKFFNPPLRKIIISFYNTETSGSNSSWINCLGEIIF